MQQQYIISYSVPYTAVHYKLYLCTGFPYKTKMPISKMLKDQFYRQQVYRTEHIRNTLKFITYSEEASQKSRVLAQCALNDSDISTRPTAVRNRCIYTGRARYVFKDLKMCRHQLKSRVKHGQLDLQLSKW